MFDLFDKAEKHDFVIAADECYPEIYFDESQLPRGLLEYAANYGNTSFKNCMVFHSLSKRSNLPGLRSGFVAGDARIIEQYFKYRTYHGCTMPEYAQSASIAAWNDETHVIANRQLYREKFEAVISILDSKLEVEMPEGGFISGQNLERVILILHETCIRDKISLSYPVAVCHAMQTE